MNTNYVPVWVFTRNHEMDALFGRLAAQLPSQFEALSNRIAGTFPTSQKVKVTTFAAIVDAGGKELLRVEYSADSVAPFSSLSGIFTKDHLFDTAENRFNAMVGVATYIDLLCPDKTVTIKAGYQVVSETASAREFAAALKHGPEGEIISKDSTEYTIYISRA